MIKHWIAGFLIVVAGAIYLMGRELATMPFSPVVGAIFGSLLGAALWGGVLLVIIVIKMVFRVESHARIVYGASTVACAFLVLIGTINNTPRKRLKHWLPNAPEHAEVLGFAGCSVMEVHWAAKFHAPAPEIRRMIEANKWQFVDEVDEPDKHFIFLFSLAQAKYENPGRSKCYFGKAGGLNYKAYVNSAEDLVLLVISQ